VIERERWLSCKPKGKKAKTQELIRRGGGFKEVNV
jgi:hypothetical protein